MLTKANINAWQRLKQVLAKVKPSKFDMLDWIDKKKWKGKVDLSCGTTACAAGWATTDPYFRRKGLRFERQLTDSYGYKLSHPDVNFDPNGKLEEIFGDTDLFYSAQCTPKQFIKRIDEMLEVDAEDSSW
jgi:hypothetical protein